MLTVQYASLDWALSHATAFGDTDVLPTPFEYSALEHDWARCREVLRKADVTRWTVRPHRTLLAPKGPLGFRPINQLDPLDFLLFSAIVLEIASDLEAFRVPRDEEIVFASRVSATKSGELYDSNIGYAAFLRRTGELLDSDSRITYVATSDIADFYPRIYHHRLEGALRAATRMESHVDSVLHFLGGWNSSESYGLPVGSAPTRLLAEVTLADVDQALLAQGVRFVRFVDDYRIFARSYAEGYRHLGILADTLYRNHGLTLQTKKTSILPKEIFVKRFMRTAEGEEMRSLHEKFDALIDELGLSDPYEYIEYDDLSPDQQALVDSLNLTGLFYEALADRESSDLRIVRFALHRLTQLGDSSLAAEVISRIDQLYPIFPDVLEYLEMSDPRHACEQHELKRNLVELVKNSVISELEYYGVWVFDYLARASVASDGRTIAELLNTTRSSFGRRKLILAMGRANQRYWFQSQWRTAFDEPHWPRRALLAGASCLAGDSSNHWYRSMTPRLDALENAVVSWAAANPFGVNR